MKFMNIDGCPVPAELYDELMEIRRLARLEMPGFIYNSIYRGSDPKAASILRRFGKSTQAALYALFLAGRGNPANMPGFSTHELFNDGVAYAVPRGTPLRYWMVGIDSSSAAVFCRAAKKRGWVATITYPNNPREAQHANLRKEPKLKVFRNLHRGDKTPRVRSVRATLAGVGYGDAKRKGGSQLFFDEALYHTIREFQRDHHIKDTGIYDYTTAKQLRIAVKIKKK